MNTTYSQRIHLSIFITSLSQSLPVRSHCPGLFVYFQGHLTGVATIPEIEQSDLERAPLKFAYSGR